MSLASERSERDTLRCNVIEISLYLLASERSERAQSCSCSIEISDTYVYIYLYHLTSLLMHPIGPKVWIK